VPSANYPGRPSSQSAFQCARAETRESGFIFFTSVNCASGNIRLEARVNFQPSVPQENRDEVICFIPKFKDIKENAPKVLEENEKIIKYSNNLKYFH
jgi:hypothetical protein